MSEEIFEISLVRTKEMPQKGREVVIRGGHSGYVRCGEISNTNAVFKSTTAIAGSRKILFFQTYYIEGNLGFIKGDSGSAVVDKATRDLVGIYMGATDARTYV